MSECECGEWKEHSLTHSLLPSFFFLFFFSVSKRDKKKKKLKKETHVCLIFDTQGVLSDGSK